MLKNLYLYYYKIRNFNYYIFLYPIKLVTYLHEKKLDEITKDTKIIKIINIISIIFLYIFFLMEFYWKIPPYRIRIP